MIIDEITYTLPSDNYIAVENPKKQIVIGNTFNHDMRHVDGWLHRYHGKYQRTASFSVGIDGTVYKHFNPKFQSKYLKNKELDAKTIVILIENDGWLIKDTDKNQFITWIGDIYKQPNDVVEKRWRGFSYWASYPEKQMESVVNLVKMLCKEFNIPASSISHNTKIEDLIGYEGVLYKSNLEKHFTDLNPSWDFLCFKKMIEF